MNRVPGQPRKISAAQVEAVLARTPPAASWLNLVERWFAALPEKQIRRGGFRSTRELEAAIPTFLDHHHTQPKPFVWAKSADAILDSIARYCRRINDSGH